MSFKKAFSVATFIWVGSFALLTAPAGANARGGWQNFAQTPEDTKELGWHEDNREMQNDREQEKRDREQEQRDREQARMDRLTEMYDRGREALDEEKYGQARE